METGVSQPASASFVRGTQFRLSSDRQPRTRSCKGKKVPPHSWRAHKLSITSSIPTNEDPAMPNSSTPRVQQTAGRTKLREGLARCRVQFALPRCPAQGRLCPWRNVPFNRTHVVRLQLPLLRKNQLRLKRRNLAVQDGGSGGGYFKFEECFATTDSRFPFWVALEVS